MRSVGESLLAQPANVDAKAVYEAVCLAVESQLQVCAFAYQPMIERWSTAGLPEAQARVEALTEIAGWVTASREGLVSFEAPLRVVLLGRTQAGKSSLFCYLTGASGERVGKGAQATTQEVTRLPLRTEPGIEVSDTPGVGALDRPEDRLVALDEARRADLVIWVCTDDSFQSEEQDALEEVLSWGTPVVLALHCFEDLSTATRVKRFLKHPDRQPRQVYATSPEGGHLARPLRTFRRRGQLPADVVPFHAAAALAAERHPALATELLSASNLEQLTALLLVQLRHERDLRRTSAAVDSCRQTLDEGRYRAQLVREEITAQNRLTAKALADLERRSARLMDTAMASVNDATHKGFSGFKGWADEHYRYEDTKRVDASLTADLSAAAADIDKVLSLRATKLQRDLRELGASVDAEWASVDAATMTFGTAWQRGLPSRWRRGVAGGAVAAAAAAAAVAAVAIPYVGPLIAPAAGAVVTAVGSCIVDKIPWLGERKRALSQRREALQKGVDARSDSAIAAVLQHWTITVDKPLRREVASHMEQAGLTNDRREELRDQFGALAEVFAQATGDLDFILVGALLELEGHADLRQSVTKVRRIPGGACAIAVDHPPHLAAMRLHPLLRGAAFMPSQKESDLASLTRLLGRRTKHGWRADIHRATSSKEPLLLVVPPSVHRVDEARRVAEFASQVLDRPVGVHRHHVMTTPSRVEFQHEHLVRPSTRRRGQPPALAS
jgi:hypothetical protein